MYKKGFAPILILILVAVLGVVFYFITQNKSAVTPVPLSFPIPAANIDSTADWKTYTNQKYGFEFKYPSDWSYKEDNSNKNKVGLNISFPQDNSINLWVISTQKSLNDYISTEFCVEFTTCNIFRTARPVFVGKQIGTKIKPGGPLPNETIILEQNSIVLELSFNYEGEDFENYSNKESKIIFDQILSTFKFKYEVGFAVEQLIYIDHPGWTTVADKSNLFQVGYDPEYAKPLTVTNGGISLTEKLADWNEYKKFISISLLPYSQKTPKQFILDNLNKGQELSEIQKSINYSEANYFYNDKLCLFLGLAGLNKTWGMCDVGNNKAFLITSDTIEEDTIASIKLLN